VKTYSNLLIFWGKNCDVIKHQQRYFRPSQHNPYDPKATTTREFFSNVQNKMHYAAHKHTAAELIYERVDSNKSDVGEEIDV
jgi:hypothetical protein